MHLEKFLAQNTQSKIFAKGDIIFKQGTQADAAYYVAEGKVEIFQDVGARTSSLAILDAGQIFGEMALLRFDEYTLSAKAAAPTRLYVITPDILQRQIEGTPPLVKAIVDMLVERIHSVNEVLIDHDRVNQV